MHSRFEPAPGVTAERVTYHTEFGMLVPAIAYFPKPMPPGKIPGIVVINGHGGDKYSWYAFYTGILYARAGAVVLTYDPAGEGERNIDHKSDTREHDQWIPPKEMARRLAGLMMTDLLQGVSFLRQQPMVDANRIGAVGYSLGSFVVSLACAVDTRLHECVAVGGGDLDWPGGKWDSSHQMCEGIPYRSLMFLGDRPAVIYALQASHASTLVYNGLDDRVVQIPTHGRTFFEDLQRRAAKLHGGANGVFEFEFSPTGGHRPWFVTKPVAIWLQEHLQFPNWTVAEIERMPVTHISVWARAHNVFIQPSYATEIRVGGTLALGDNIPAMPRNELSVFSLREWDRTKNQLVYPAWVKRAQALTPQER
ncbi:MAG: alpha/beta hydrolase family protein [Terriglobia bacterium]